MRERETCSFRGENDSNRLKLKLIMVSAGRSEKSIFYGGLRPALPPALRFALFLVLGEGILFRFWLLKSGVNKSKWTFIKIKVFVPLNSSSYR